MKHQVGRPNTLYIASDCLKGSFIIEDCDPRVTDAPEHSYDLVPLWPYGSCDLL